jgi:hypothetical protein
MQKYTREYWCAWNEVFKRGYNDGMSAKVQDPPAKWSMFYEAYWGGYHLGSEELDP